MYAHTLTKSLEDDVHSVNSLSSKLPSGPRQPHKQEPDNIEGSGHAQSWQRESLKLCIPAIKQGTVDIVDLHSVAPSSASSSS